MVEEVGHQAWARQQRVGRRGSVKHRLRQLRVLIYYRVCPRYVPCKLLQANRWLEDYHAKINRRQQNSQTREKAQRAPCLSLKRHTSTCVASFSAKYTVSSVTPLSDLKTCINACRKRSKTIKRLASNSKRVVAWFVSHARLNLAGRLDVAWDVRLEIACTHNEKLGGTP